MMSNLHSFLSTCLRNGMHSKIKKPLHISFRHMSGKTDDNGNITTEDGWDELSGNDQNRMSDLAFAYYPYETEE